jgi:hypothetical protein
MDDTTLNQILDEFEQPGFLNPTMIASGHGTVADVIGTMPNIRVLVEQRSSSVPLITARYRERDAAMADHERLVYFVVFGLLNQRQMSHDIIAYLRGCRRVPHSTLASPWHPFLHGIKTLELFTGGQVQAPKSNASMKEFERFIDGVAKWEQTHTQPGTKQR